MNQLIKKSNAIIYVIIGMALLVFLAIWPAGIIHQTYVSKSDEKVAMESDAVNVEHNLTQMFVAEDDYLSAVDLYVTNEMQGETITFRLYDASYLELYNIFYVVPSGTKIPGFVHIPVGYETVKDQEYYYTIEGLSTDLYVNLEDNTESTSIVNGILAYAGEEFPGYNIIMRYEYSNPFLWWQVILSALVIAAITGALCCLVKRLFTKVWKDREIKVQSVFQVIFNPLIAIATVAALYMIFPGRKFGVGIINYAFYGISVLMFSTFLLYEVNYKRKDTQPLMTLTILKEHLPDWLQAGAFAGVLWYCFEYMNGLYDIHHAYATCKILIWFCIAIITTYRKKELLNIPNLIWLIGGSIFGYFYAKPYIDVVEQGELYKLQAYVIVVGGFVIINMVMSIIALIRRKITARKPNLLFASLFSIFVLLLVIFRNTREWPAFIVILCVLLYFRMAIWENFSHLMENYCNAIILNFGMMVIFSLLHRPFHYYIYYRYSMGFHTVTMTAVYLTLVLSAALVHLGAKYQKDKSVKIVLPQLFLFGIGCSYLIFTLSRTGYLASGIMIFIMLLVVCFMLKRKGERLLTFCKAAGILLVSVICVFPVAFSFTRILPAIVNDPIRYEVESKDVYITKGTATYSDSYIDISRFMNVFRSKVLGVGEDITSKNSIIYPLTDKNILLASVQVKSLNQMLGEDIYLASAQTGKDEEISEEDDRDDITNGRLEIYREYIKYWNLTGHDEMGIDFSDGTNSGHAHDVYLQVIHDHGLFTGIYFIIFMGISVVLAFKNMKKNKEGGMYQALIPAILIGFLMAGITEWIFHPCNPFGMSVFVVMTPLFFRSNFRRRNG